MGEIKSYSKEGDFALCHLEQNIEGDIYWTLFYFKKKIFEGSRDECQNYASENGIELGEQNFIIENFDGISERINSEEFESIKKNNLKIL